MDRGARHQKTSNYENRDEKLHRLVKTVGQNRLRSRVMTGLGVEL